MIKYINKQFISLLRFFNMLEPQDRPILSISKIFAWLMLIIVIIVMFTMPDNLTAVLTATGTQMIAMLNYSFRRYIHYKDGKKNK